MYKKKNYRWRTWKSIRPEAVSEKHAFIRIKYEAACDSMRTYWRNERAAPAYILHTYEAARDDLSSYITSKYGVMRIKYKEYLVGIELTDTMITCANDV